MEAGNGFLYIENIPSLENGRWHQIAIHDQHASTHFIVSVNKFKKYSLELMENIIFY